jgi:hypothetical protein
VHTLLGVLLGADSNESPVSDLVASLLSMLADGGPAFENKV